MIIAFVVAMLSLMGSAVFLKYGLWNIYYGPMDWRGDVCIITGWCPWFSVFG
jgi:hypothetical protein